MESIRPASRGEFDKIYPILVESFPPDERRDQDGQRRILDDDRYTIYVLPDGAQIKGFITVWQFETFAVVEHFAVNPDYRNQGIGSQMLDALKELLPCRIVLEVELPETEFARRRIGFYRRNGFTLCEFPYLQPPYSKEKHPLPLLLMSTEGGLSKEEFDAITATMKREIYKAP